MSNPLTRADLDGMRCGHPGCSSDHGRWYFHSRCHMEEGTWVSYQDGVLIIECKVCKKVVALLRIAEGP